MRFTVRVKEGYEKTLKQITDICEATNTSYHMKEYSMMVSIEVSTGDYSKLSGYVSEDHYLSGKYGLRIYNKENYDMAIFIPIKDLDEIYTL